MLIHLAMGTLATAASVAVCVWRDPLQVVIHGPVGQQFGVRTLEHLGLTAINREWQYRIQATSSLPLTCRDGQLGVVEMERSTDRGIVAPGMSVAWYYGSLREEKFRANRDEDELEPMLLQLEQQYGWPWRATVEGLIGINCGVDTIDDRLATAQQESLTTRFGLWGGIDVGMPVRLPVYPLWPGLLADIGFFAGCSALLGASWRFLGYWHKRQRGGCIACGYPIEGLERCPECGLSKPLPIEHHSKDLSTN